jgi:hypothetical protein
MAGKMKGSELRCVMVQEFSCDQDQAARYAWTSMQAVGAKDADNIMRCDPEEAVAWIRACKHEGSRVLLGLCSRCGHFALPKDD